MKFSATAIRPILFSVTLLFAIPVTAQDANALVEKVKQKLSAVRDYEATGIMKTDVSFMKIPDSKVMVYYKNPDKFKIKKQDGISIVPKGGVNINLGTLFSGNNYTTVPAGNGTVNGTAVTIVKLLPLDENNDVVVSTLYIDEKENLVRKAVITTRENGTYEMELQYGKYADKGLPDKVTFVFATKDYKLPKGLAFDYDTGEKPKPAANKNGDKGKVEISYTNYTINKGLPDAVFQ